MLTSRNKSGHRLATVWPCGPLFAIFAERVASAASELGEGVIHAFVFHFEHIYIKVIFIVFMMRRRFKGGYSFYDATSFQGRICVVMCFLLFLFKEVMVFLGGEFVFRAVC